MSSDVCKHCTHAACLDVCPTGALFRTEFGTVVVQDDVCNGCGYCVPACPYGVIDKREDGRPGCTSARCATTGSSVGLEPACAKACPTESIQFGDLDELRERARTRVEAAARGGGDRGPALRRTTRATASAATARSSCCSTSPRSTACRRTRSSPPGTCRGCGGTPRSPRRGLAGRRRGLLRRAAAMSDVTRQGVQDQRPGRDATVGSAGGRTPRPGEGERRPGPQAAAAGGAARP